MVFSGLLPVCTLCIQREFVAHDKERVVREWDPLRRARNCGTAVNATVRMLIPIAAAPCSQVPVVVAS
jgi:hypothetical protein